MKVHLLLITFLLSNFLIAQVQRPTGAKSMSVGNANTAWNGDEFSFFSNVANLRGLDSSKTVGAYFERRYNLSDLQYGAVSFSMPFKEKHTFAAGVSSLGWDQFHQTYAGLAYSTTLFEKLRTGIRVGYLNSYVQNYGSIHSFLVDVGMAFEVTKTFDLAFKALNVSNSKMENDQIPVILAIGGCFHPGKKAKVLMEFEKTLRYKPNLKLGVDYQMTQTFRLGFGANTYPLSYSAGFGVTFNQFLIDLATQYHQTLGITPALQLVYKF